MKKIAILSILALIVLWASSCNQKPTTPAGIERSIYAHVQKGNYEEARAIFVGRIDGIQAQEGADLVNSLFSKGIQSVIKNGGIKSFEIVSEDIAADGLSAIVITHCIYGNGTERDGTTKYVYSNGEWKISLGNGK